MVGHRDMMASQLVTERSKSYEKVKIFTYVGSIDKYYLNHNEITCRFKAANSCCNFVQISLSSRLIIMNVKMKI